MKIQFNLAVFAALRSYCSKVIKLQGSLSKDVAYAKRIVLMPTSENSNTNASSSATCSISGQAFLISELEWKLRRLFGFDSSPMIAPEFRFRELGAFWPHWNMHRRKCDLSGRSIISVFRSDCAFPVWNRDDWIAHAAPPHADFDFSRPLFEQAWQLFSNCPLPHTFCSAIPGFDLLLAAQSSAPADDANN